MVDASISSYSNSSRDTHNGISIGANGLPVVNPFYVNQGSVKVSKRALANSGYNSSRLGFRGTEDLGGGLAASFWLEAPISNDDGATGVSSFKRRSTVSLSGGFGEVRLGRDYTPTFWNDTVFDPFGTNGVGSNLINTANGYNPKSRFDPTATGGFGGNTNYDRASNSIGYFLPPNLGGFYGQVMYAFNEQTKFKSNSAALTNAFYKDNTARAGRYVGGRFGYANGPLDVAIAYGSSITGDQYQAGITSKVNTLNLGASYDFGPVKLFGEYSKAKNKIDYASQQFNIVDRDNGTDLTGYLLGVTVPVGVGLIRASYSAVKYDRNQQFAFNQFAFNKGDEKANKLAIGYVHNLSKRTALYATVARVSNKNGAALSTSNLLFSNNTTFTPKTSTGYDFGIRHAF